jgi:hypothetical protein
MPAEEVSPSAMFVLSFAADVYGASPWCGFRGDSWWVGRLLILKRYTFEVYLFYGRFILWFKSGFFD